MRSLCVRTDNDKESLQNVLNDFFDLTDDGYKHKRCEKELTRIYDKSEKARQSAKRRWSKENQQDTSIDNANAKQTQCERTPKAMLPSNLVTQLPSNPLLKDIDLSPAKADPIPYKAIINLYHEKLKDLPRVAKLTDKRKTQIRKLWKEDLETLDQWGHFFDWVAKSDFLMGRKEPINGRPLFRADIEWLTNQTNFTKIAEDKYHV